MKVLFSPQASRDLDAIDSSLRKFFVKHAEKLGGMPPRRHLKLGLPYSVEDVTKQSRMVYEIEGDSLSVYRCFATHKEYEKWYKSFK